MINADQALDYGLINYKTSSDQLMTFIDELAKKILSNSSNAIKHSLDFSLSKLPRHKKVSIHNVVSYNFLHCNFTNQ